MIGEAPDCGECKHFHFEKRGFFCDAFPEGIPDDIIDGRKHRKPRKGDHGIQFEPRATERK